MAEGSWQAAPIAAGAQIGAPGSGSGPSLRADAPDDTWAGGVAAVLGLLGAERTAPHAAMP